LKNFITLLGLCVYATLLAIALLGLFAFYPAKADEARFTNEEAGRYTCEDVRWAKENLSQDAIKAIKTRMTFNQLAKAAACLYGYKVKQSVSKYYPTHDIAK
jgi:hypothetical protein